MLRNSLAVIACAQGSGSFEQHDACAVSRLRAMFDAVRDNEDIVTFEVDERLVARLSQPDVEAAIEHDEHLVGLRVRMPDERTCDFGEAYVVVVDLGEDSRAPELLKRSQDAVNICTRGSHAYSFTLALAAGKCNKWHMSQAFSQLHHVVALVDEDSNPFELACLTEGLGIERPEVGGLLYKFHMCAREPSVTMRQNFFTMTDIATLSVLQEADTVIVPNRPNTAAPHHPEVLEAIAGAHDRGSRMVGMCSGAFTLAEAGLLDGRRATVHWQWADEFRARYPHVHVDDDVLFVDDGNILTSAGSAAALDLALYLVRRDHGAEIGAAVARRLVFPGHRPGGQRQFIERPTETDSESSLAETLIWAEQHATGQITVAEIASRAAMNPATLHRRFRRELGCTPLQWLTAIRVEHARRLLEQTDLAVDQVASCSGLGTAANFRSRLFADTGLTPTAYRRAFSR